MGVRSTALAISLGLLLGACASGPDDAALDRLLDEARQAEAAAQAAHAVEDERTRWTLTVGGRVAGAPRRLAWPELERLATDEIRSFSEGDLRGDEERRYRGVRLARLLEEAGGALPAETEVTLVAFDGFRATVALDDVVRFPILLAVEANGAPLRREVGGPLLAVFPNEDHPELRERYTSSSWVYYVTHLVVGTDPPALRVGSRTLDAAALAALPAHEAEVAVGYRIGWPSEPVRVAGPSVGDVLAAAGVAIPEGHRVRVRSIAPISRSGERPTFVSRADALSGDAFLALRQGPDDAPIPSRLGGPVALAFSEARAASADAADWLTFVDELVVEPEEAP